MPDLVSTSGSSFLALDKCGRRPIVIILRLDLFEQARHGFHVVIQNLGPRIHHDLQGFERTFEIGDQHFDRTARQHFADASDDHRKDRRAAIAAFIAVHRGDHRMLQVHRFHSLRHALGFAPIHQCGLAVFDIAESAGARAYIAEHQKGRGA